jgi:hypothetical protein
LASVRNAGEDPAGSPRGRDLKGVPRDLKGVPRDLKGVPRDLKGVPIRTMKGNVERIGRSCWKNATRRALATVRRVPAE